VWPPRGDVVAAAILAALLVLKPSPPMQAVEGEAVLTPSPPSRKPVEVPRSVAGINRESVSRKGGRG
jgi:hypothetical protein